jgi:hypothetical protein
MRSREGLGALYYETDEQDLSLVQHVLHVGLLTLHVGGSLPHHDLSFSLFHPWRALFKGQVSREPSNLKLTFRFMLDSRE